MLQIKAAQAVLQLTTQQRIYDAKMAIIIATKPNP
jgi:hypothetical protein